MPDTSSLTTRFHVGIIWQTNWNESPELEGVKQQKRNIKERVREWSNTKEKPNSTQIQGSCKTTRMTIEVKYREVATPPGPNNIRVHSMEQNTVGTSAYDSEAYAARTANEQVMSMHTAMRDLGVATNEQHITCDNMHATMEATSRGARIAPQSMNTTTNQTEHQRQMIMSEVIWYHRPTQPTREDDLTNADWTWNTIPGEITKQPNVDEQ